MSRIVKYVKRTKAKGCWYYYFDTGQFNEKGKRIWKRLPDPKDRIFTATYAALLGHRTRRDQVETGLTVEKLVELYQASPRYTKLAPSTQKLYAIYLGQLVAKIGNGFAQRIERKDIVLLLDKMAGRPGAANMVQATGSAAYAWARQRGHITNNPFADIDMMELGEHEPWPQDLLDAALKCENDQVRLAVHLLYFTAQRIGDVVAFTWRDVETSPITVTQKKTSKTFDVPIHAALARELARHARSLGTILGGRPTESRIGKLRDDIQAFASGLGYEVVPHGLRKNAVNALLEAGCSAAEAASISGQSLQMVEHYAKRRSQSKLGQAAILKWERIEK